MRSLILLLTATAALAQAPRLANPGFEQSIALPADHAALKAGWQLDAARLARSAGRSTRPIPAP